MAGDALGALRVNLSLWLAVVLAGVALLGFVARAPSVATAIALTAITAAASVPSYQLVAPPQGGVGMRRFEEGSVLTMEGTLTREPERMPDHTRLYVNVSRAGDGEEALSPENQPTLTSRSAASSPWSGRGRERVGAIRVVVQGADGRYIADAGRIGDMVRFSGRLRFPRNYGDPGEFDYEGFVSREGIDATMMAKEGESGRSITILARHPSFPTSQVESIRRRIANFIGRNLRDPEAAELRALVIGDRGGITDRMHQVFGRTGMAHLLVISGLHLSMVGAAIFVLVRLLTMISPTATARGWPNKAAALAAGVGVAAYAVIAGHHVSTMRALVMVVAYMFAIVIDRAREALASLALAAIIICVAIPGSSADIGFQLSFASVITIVLGMQRYTAWASMRRRLRSMSGGVAPRREIAIEWIMGYVAVSFWAMIGTAPLTAYYFNQFSIVGLIANAVVVPIMGFGGTVLGLAASAMSFVWDAPARLMLSCAGQLIALGNWCVDWFVRWPGAWFAMFTPTWIEIALVYALLAIWLTRPLPASPFDQSPSNLEALPKTTQYRRMVAAALTIAAIADAGWWTYDRWFDSRLRVTFLSVGEGDAAVVRYGGSRVMLIDAGGAGHGFDAGERLVARFLWSQKIMRVDQIAVSHPDQDHFGGVDFVARNFNPGEIWTNGDRSDDVGYQSLMDTIAALRIPVRVADNRSPPLELAGTTIAVLNPKAEPTIVRNNASMIIRAEKGGSAILFTGDLEAQGERALIDTGADLRAAILKVPHHGSRTSSSSEFIDAVRPRAAVISLGYRNRFHFPAAEVVDHYRAEGAHVLRTDIDGAVTATIDDDGAMSVESYRGSDVVSFPDD
ncbi:MAG TPA: DNA internalization-related competence protein ComEC/Rec2 [Candidatus Binataceae bacterium]|nr:DNA internalization-related competence protein ComEC/Rec2 [Candidatus Binataceae bacterium]